MPINPMTIIRRSVFLSLIPLFGLSENSASAEVSEFSAGLNNAEPAQLIVPLSGVSDTGVGIVDLSSLDAGFHNVVLVVEDSDGEKSSPISLPFSFDPEVLVGVSTNIEAAEVFFDSDPGEGEGFNLVVNQGGEVSIIAHTAQAINIAQLEPGLHSLYLRMRDATDLWSAPISIPFVVDPETSLSLSENKIVSGRYQLDSRGVVDAGAADGAYDSVVESFDQTEEVTDSYHSIQYEFSDSYGRVGGTRYSESPLAAHLAYDTDRDGLLDAWELAEFGNLGYTGIDDPDGDGRNNFEELFEGTDPGAEEGGGFAQLSGQISSLGEAVEGITVCIKSSLMLRCEAMSDQAGQFSLNSDMPLPVDDYQVFVKPDGGYQASPEQISISLDQESISGLDFELIDNRSLDLSVSQLGDPNRNGIATPAVGFGVNSSNGNFFYSQLDAAMPGKDINFAFMRYYNSQVGGDFSSESTGNSLSERWRHSYEIELSVNESAGVADVIWGDGRVDKFFKLSEIWLGGTPGNFSELYADGESWVIETQSHMEYVFNSVGQLQKIRRDFENGDGSHELVLSYNANGQVEFITDTAKRVVEFGYDEGKLVNMFLPGPTTDCHGTGKRTVAYQYFASGELKTVLDMNCNEQQFVYSESTMLVFWKGTSDAAVGTATPKLKVSYDDEGRVEKQETGQNLSLGSGEYIFNWSESSLDYQTPTTIGNANFTFDALGRANTITESGKVQRIDYFSPFGAQSVLPSGINDFENHEYGASFTNTDLTEVMLPDGRKREMVYNNHDVVSLITENQLEVSTPRNAQGRLTEMSASGVGVTETARPNMTLGYAAGDLLNSVTSATANGLKSEVAQFASDGQPLEVRTFLDASNYLSRFFTYDEAGRQRSEKDHRGTLSCYYYDDESNIVDTVQGLVADECPEIPPSSNSELRRTHNVYDEENRVIQISEGFGSAVQYDTFFDFNPETGDLFKTCGPGRGRCTEYRYDSDSRIEISTRADNRRDRFYSVQNGRVRITRENADKVDSAFDRIVRFEYDGNGRLISESSCLNMESPESSISDCEVHNVRRAIERDSLGRPTSVSNIVDINDESATGKRVFQYEYSADGLTTTVLGPENQDTIFERDALGNLIRVTERKGDEELSAFYEYDGDGRLIKTTDPEGLITSYTHDGLGRRLSKTDLSGSMTWAYNDVAGTVRTTYSDGTTIDASLDRLGQLASVSASDTNNFTYGYDALGRLSQESWSGLSGLGSRAYTYTVYNELDTVIDPFGVVMDYDWDVVSRLTKKSFGGNSINYGYNGLDEMATLQNAGRTFSFGIDDYTGTLLRTTYPQNSGLETIYQRNDLGELLRLTTRKNSDVIVDYDITLDGLGRRSNIAVEQPLAPGFGNETLTVETVQAGANIGLLDTINGNTVTYDGRGNITNLPSPYPANYSYDAMNRVTSANSTSHQYDANRNRTQTVRDGETTRYLLDLSGSLPDLQATLNEQNQIQNQYLYGPGGLLAETKADGSIRYPHSDFNYNITALTNEDGDVVSSYAYTPFGRNAGLVGDPNFPFRFAGGVGAQTDSEGLVYMRARYYQPEIQQFSSADLIDGVLERPQSLHRYGYVEGDPVNNIDPSGLILGTSDIYSNFMTARRLKKQVDKLSRQITNLQGDYLLSIQKGDERSAAKSEELSVVLKEMYAMRSAIYDQIDAIGGEVISDTEVIRDAAFLTTSLVGSVVGAPLWLSLVEGCAAPAVNIGLDVFGVGYADFDKTDEFSDCAISVASTFATGKVDNPVFSFAAETSVLTVGNIGKYALGSEDITFDSMGGQFESLLEKNVIDLSGHYLARTLKVK